jgi:antitoxin FitA
VLNGIKRTPPLGLGYNRDFPAGKRLALNMCSTCNYTGNMTRMIQIRNVPVELHRKLKSRAALEGTSLSEYLLKEIRQVAERPTLEELAERLKNRTRVTYRISPARILREERSRR